MILRLPARRVYHSKARDPPHRQINIQPPRLTCCPRQRETQASSLSLLPRGELTLPSNTSRHVPMEVLFYPRLTTGVFSISNDLISPNTGMSSLRRHSIVGRSAVSSVSPQYSPKNNRNPLTPPEVLGSLAESELAFFFLFGPTTSPLRLASEPAQSTTLIPDMFSCLIEHDPCLFNPHLGMTIDSGYNFPPPSSVVCRVN